MPLKAYLKFGNIYIFPLYFISSGQFHFTAIFYHLDNFISLLFFMIWTVSFHCYFISSGQFHFTAIFYHLDNFISLLFFIIWTVSFHCYFLSSGQFHFTAFCKTFSSFFSLFLSPSFLLSSLFIMMLSCHFSRTAKGRWGSIRPESEDVQNWKHPLIWVPKRWRRHVDDGTEELKLQISSGSLDAVACSTHLA